MAKMYFQNDDGVYEEIKEVKSLRFALLRRNIVMLFVDLFYRIKKWMKTSIN